MAKVRRLGTSQDNKNFIYNHESPTKGQLSKTI